MNQVKICGRCQAGGPPCNVEETDRNEEPLFERVARIGHFSHRTGRWDNDIPIRDIQPPRDDFITKCLLELFGSGIRWATVMDNPQEVHYD